MTKQKEKKKNNLDFLDDPLFRQKYKVYCWDLWESGVDITTMINFIIEFIQDYANKLNTEEKQC